MTTAPPALPVRPASDRADSKPLAGRRFVWSLVPPWDNVWTRQNHFTTRLARLGAEVLYVESPFAAATLWKQGQLGRRLFGHHPRFAQKAPGLTILQTPPLLPGGMHSDVIGRFNARRVAAAVNGWLRARGWTDYTCWCRVPFAALLLDQLAPARVYYDITDDYKHFYQSPRVIERLDRREKRLVARCAKIFYTAERLGALENLRGKPAFLLPTGVDYELFAQAAAPDLPAHPFVAAAAQPVIGYVGLTTDWVDFELLRKLGGRFPGQVVMVGPIHPKVEAQARAIPGLRWTGFVADRAELPRFLKGFAVCLLPFLTNELTRNMNPLKVWEYLATGKPFVSVDLAGLGEARPLVDVAADHEAFLKLVAERLAGDAAGRAAARQQLARRYSWDALFEQLLDHLEPRAN
jgi:glycosyltransferase involved in cell wall biosynthesis